MVFYSIQCHNCGKKNIFTSDTSKKVKEYTKHVVCSYCKKKLILKKQQAG